jgi:hypothetical protein
MATLKYSNLKSSTASFADMMKQFGVVTVMNAKVYEAEGEDWYASQAVGSGNFGNADTIIADFEGRTPICTLKTLKIANVTVEGPTKTITGGQYANTLVKYGKTARLEMQDALGNAKALEALAGALVEYTAANGDISALHNGSDFSSVKTIIGDSFFIDKDGQQVKVKIIFYRFNPDSLFNLTQDAEGDATVFDLNGDLLMTNIKVSNNASNASIEHGVFYSILAA